jgi:putative MFS transporter
LGAELVADIGYRDGYAARRVAVQNMTAARYIRLTMHGEEAPMTAVELAARLDRLPLSRFHRRVLYGLAFGFFFELADLSTFSYAAPGLEKYLGLTIDDIALVTSIAFLGMFLGATVGGRLADAFGRRRMLLAAIAWYSFWSLVNAFMWNVPSLLVARMLTGAGLGAMTS